MVATSDDANTNTNTLAIDIHWLHHEHIQTMPLQLSSFRILERKYATSLATHIWQLNDNVIPYTISWRIIENLGAYINRYKCYKSYIVEQARILKD